jgi:hypothetical protein
MDKIQKIQKDIDKLEKALKLIEKTQYYFLYEKSNIIFELCKNINILKDKQQTLKNILNK